MKWGERDKRAGRVGHRINGVEVAHRQGSEGGGIPWRLYGLGLIPGQFFPGKEGAHVLRGGQGIRGGETLAQAIVLEPDRRRVPRGRRWQRPGHLVPE